MKLTCDQPKASEALANLASVVSTKAQNPITLNVRIVAEKDAVTFYATDFERSLRYTLTGIQVDKPGEVCLPAKRLSDSVKLLDPTEPMVLTSTAEGADIRSGKTKYSIRGQNPADFPTFREFSAKDAFKLPSDAVRKMSDMVSFAIATEKTRYSLNGVLLEVKKNELTMVGSDGKRLAMISRKFEIGRDFQPHVIVPKKGLDLVTWLATTAPEVEIEIRDNQLLARTPSAVVSTQLVAGLYPNFRQVLPDETKMDKKAVIGRQSFLQNLQRTRIFTSDESMSVRFAFATNKLTMSARSPEEGEAEVEVDIVYGSPSLDVGYDPKFLLDALRVLESEDVVLMMSDADSPGIIRQNIGDYQYLYLVMPTDLG